MGCYNPSLNPTYSWYFERKCKTIKKIRKIIFVSKKIFNITAVMSSRFAAVDWYKSTGIANKSVRGKLKVTAK